MICPKLFLVYFHKLFLIDHGHKFLTQLMNNLSSSSLSDKLCKPFVGTIVVRSNSAILQRQYSPMAAS